MKVNVRKIFRNSFLVAFSIATPIAAQTNISESNVEAFELEPEEERESIIESAEEGPEVDVSWFQESTNLDSIERTETALNRLVTLVETTPVNNAQRPNYMFRLAELYYDRARYYEQQTYNMRDQAFELQQENPARADAYERRANDYLVQSDEASRSAINLYRSIYLDHPTFEDIDAVLYYLGANYLQIGENDNARIFFEELAQNFPQSEYLQQSHLLLGELDFAEGYMESAQLYYSFVATDPGTSIHYYALYKIAWCIYNLAQGPDDYEEGLDILLEVIEGTDALEGRGDTRLQRDALRDMVLFYAEVGRADRAYRTFNAISPDEAFNLSARLARIYGEKGEYEDSNTLYRELIGLNQGNFEIVSYQREIVRNTRPGNDYIEIVTEVRRLVELYDIALQYENSDPSDVEKMQTDIERLLRQLATTYHREGRVTENEILFALSEELYEDYIQHFPDSENAYTMWYYYGEILYWHHEDWLNAARAYEEVLARGPGEHDEMASLAACISYTSLIDLEAAVQVDMSNENENTEEEEMTAIPEAVPIPDDYLRMFNVCDRYQGEGIDETRAIEIQYAIAFIYYDHNHLDEAVERFGSIALNFFEVDPHRAKIAAELLLDSLALQRKFEDMSEWVDVFLESPIATTDLGPRLELLQEQIAFATCRDKMDREEHLEAAQCFVGFNEVHYTSDLLDRALFNAGICYERADELDFAVSVYQYLIDQRPDSELVPETIYGLAQTYHRLAIYDEAASQYEQYVLVEPEGEHVINSLANAYQFRHGLGQYAQAIDDLETFIDVSDRRDEEELQGIAEAYYQIALIEEEQGNRTNAINAFRRILENYEDVLPGRALESYFHIADIYAESERWGRAYTGYEETLQFADGLDPEVIAELSPSALDAASESRFMIGERIYQRFEEIELEGDEQEVQEALLEKRDVGQEAASVYEQVFEYYRPGWAICAFNRLGRLYHVFYEQIIDAPIPRGLDPLVEDQYLTMLENQASEIKMEARDRYERAITIARDSGWFNDCSDEAATFLQELDPNFRAGSEARIAPGFDSTSFYTPPFVSFIEEEEDIMEEVPAEEVDPMAIPSDPTTDESGENTEETPSTNEETPSTNNESTDETTIR